MKSVRIDMHWIVQHWPELFNIDQSRNTFKIFQFWIPLHIYFPHSLFNKTKRWLKVHHFGLLVQLSILPNFHIASFRNTLLKSSYCRPCTKLENPCRRCFEFSVSSLPYRVARKTSRTGCNSLRRKTNMVQLTIFFAFASDTHFTRVGLFFISPYLRQMYVIYMCLCHQYYYLLCPLSISSLWLAIRMVRILS